MFQRRTGLNLIAIASALIILAQPCANAADNTLSGLETAVDREFRTLALAQESLRRSASILRAALAPIDPANAPEAYVASMQAGIDAMLSDIDKIRTQFNPDGELASLRALAAFANDRIAVVRQAEILEQDRAALLKIWDAINARISENLSAIQTMAKRLAEYRRTLTSHRITIGEYLIVGEVETVKRLAAEILNLPDMIAPPTPAKLVSGRSQ